MLPVPVANEANHSSATVTVHRIWRAMRHCVPAISFDCICCCRIRFECAKHMRFIWVECCSVCGSSRARHQNEFMIMFLPVFTVQCMFVCRFVFPSRFFSVYLKIIHDCIWFNAIGWSSSSTKTAQLGVECVRGSIETVYLFWRVHRVRDEYALSRIDE